jgi:hypothetical protein
MSINNNKSKKEKTSLTTKIVKNNKSIETDKMKNKYITVISTKIQHLLEK